MRRQKTLIRLQQSAGPCWFGSRLKPIDIVRYRSIASIPNRVVYYNWLPMFVRIAFVCVPIISHPSIEICLVVFLSSSALISSAAAAKEWVQKIECHAVGNKDSIHLFFPAWSPHHVNVLGSECLPRDWYKAVNSSIRHPSSLLSYHKSIVLVAVSQNANALNMVDEELQGDKDIFLASISSASSMEKDIPAISAAFLFVQNNVDYVVFSFLKDE